MLAASRRTLAVVVSIVLAMVLAAVAIGLISQERTAEAQEEPPPATLSGEELGGFDATLSDINCDPNGTSGFTLRVTGAAIGPYPGTFEETIKVTIGPQTEPGPLDPTLPVNEGPLQTLTANFKIVSGTTEITGTKKLETDFPFNEGTCAEFEPTALFPGSTTLVTGYFAFCGAAEYEATIRNTLTNETFKDSGISGVCSNIFEQDVDGRKFLFGGLLNEIFISGPTGPELPEIKEECKDGGFEDFDAGFENQGDCVAFVETATNPGNLNEIGQNVPTSQE